MQTRSVWTECTLDAGGSSSPTNCALLCRPDQDGDKCPPGAVCEMTVGVGVRTSNSFSIGEAVSVNTFIFLLSSCPPSIAVHCRFVCTTNNSGTRINNRDTTRHVLDGDCNFFPPTIHTHTQHDPSTGYKFPSRAVVFKTPVVRVRRGQARAYAYKSLHTRATCPHLLIYEDWNLWTALVPSETACFASSPGRTRRTAV